jgi:hypothetical protein
MLTRTRSNSFVVKGALARAVQFAGRCTGQGSNAIRQDTNGLPQVRLNHDALERLEFGFLAEHMHPADGSVQDVIDKAPRCYSRCSWHEHICCQNGELPSIPIASGFKSPLSQHELSHSPRQPKDLRDAPIGHRLAPTQRTLLDRLGPMLSAMRTLPSHQAVSGHSGRRSRSPLGVSAL